MAFGTGLHSTTRLCLAALEDTAVAGARVLDVGTGSGILAVAAARQGAAEVLALDMDPQAVEVAEENVARNDVSGVVRVLQGTVRAGGVQVAGTEGADALPRSPYDLVLANILAPVIIGMAEGLARSLVPGGVLVSSGILRRQADEVEAALAAAGVSTEARPAEGDWIALVGRRAGRG
jgi:ribosomal protein L11 methyltransferase